MARLYRLLSPSLVFAVAGLATLATGEWPWTQFRGGLTVVGLYAFALQLVLSALLISAIDDLSGSGLWHRLGRGRGKLLSISAQPISFPRALGEIYQRSFWDRIGV